MRRRQKFLIAVLVLIPLAAALAHAQPPDSPHPSGEPEVIRTFFLENAEVKDMMTILRSMLGIKHVAVAEDVHAIVVRDRLENVELAAAIVRLQDQPRDEVVVQVELLELDRPTIPDVAPAGVPARLAPDQHERLIRSDGVKVLARPSLSAVAGKQAELLIGDRVPIDTGEAVSYQEVGLKVVVVPRVHAGAAEVTLDFHLEMSRPGAEVGGPQRPAVETRRVTSSARLGDGSSYLVTGLTGGGAGREGREIGLVLTPHIVRRLEAGREVNLPVEG